MSHALAALNAVRLTGVHLENALRNLQLLPVGQRNNPSAQAQMLDAFVESLSLSVDGGAPEALQARIMAFRAWTLAHPPEDAAHAAAMIEAAARIRLVDTGSAIEFDADAFDDFVAFVSAFPA